MSLTPAERSSRDLEKLFNREFSARYRTVLEGGAEEPFYLPATDKEAGPHRLIYREDYFSSALHEIAHWCIAGERRRRLPDFGYWYIPDGRSAARQRAFERVEARPQALEWIFSTAAGIGFSVSADNLSGNGLAAGPSREFLGAVERSALAWLEKGLPRRARRFARVLQQFYQVNDHLDAGLYQGGLCRG